MADLRCLIGLHAFDWPPHTPSAFGLWTDYDIDCARGCGARRTRSCLHRNHWQEKHPEPHEQGSADG